MLYLCALAALFAGSAGPALAHARYDHSTPNPGEVVQTSPARVDIYTAQDMRKVAGADEITVTGPNGSRVDDGTTVVDDNNRRHFSVGLNRQLPAGRYLVAFKTLSDEDGEADHGSFAFYVNTPPTAAQKQEDQKLTLTSKTEDADADASSPSHTGLYVGIAVIVVVLIAAGAGGVMWLRRARP